MARTTGTAATPSSPARRRVVDTAARLFYAEGIHTVGIDRIIAEAGVAKATFYSHFPAKNDLVAEYLSEQHASQRAKVAALRAEGAAQGRPPQDTIRAVFDAITLIGCGPGFRGCAFLNAAAEYPDPGHPVRRVVAGFRGWFRDTMRELLAEAGHPDPGRTAEMLLLVRDGVVVGSHLDDATTVRELVLGLVDRVLGDEPDGATTR